MSSRCRWTANPSSPSLFVKYSHGYLNVLDTEKEKITLTMPLEIEKQGGISLFFVVFSLSYHISQVAPFWIEVYPNDGNLLALEASNKLIQVIEVFAKKYFFS